MKRTTGVAALAALLVSAMTSGCVTGLPSRSAQDSIALHTFTEAHSGIDASIVRTLEEENAPMSLVQERVGRPAGRHFVGSADEVWTYLAMDLREMNNTLYYGAVIPIDHATVTFQSGHVIDAVVKRCQIAVVNVNTWSW